MLINKINPFPTTGYLGKEYFCDRESELFTLKRQVENNINTTLILTSSTCHPKFFVEQRGDALMSFHEHGSTDGYLILRQCHLDGNYSLSHSQHLVDTHVYAG